MTVKDIFLTILGFLLLGIGAVGVFIPVLPTTPFVLAASACFAGNPKVRAWLLKSKFFSEHLHNYKHRTGLKKKTLAVSLGFLWVSLGVSMFVIHQLWAFVFLFAVGIAVSIHILCVARPKIR